MKLFYIVGILTGFVLTILGGCSSAARDASSNTVPLAKDVTLSASDSVPHTGTELRCRYRYVDTDGDSESGTVKVWLRDGQPIDGANNDNYTATAKDVGKKLKLRVTPAAATGKSPGVTVESQEIAIENRAPSITGLTILSSAANEVYLGVTLSASYSFQDPDGDGEGKPTTFEWRRQRGDEPIEVIGNATDPTYTVTKADIGFALTVQVTPKDNFVPAQSGTPVVSDPVMVAPASSASVVLTVSGGLKQLHFSWAVVTNATHYRLLYNPDGVSGFAPLSANNGNLTATTYDWDIPVHRINWAKAQFVLEACDAANICLLSASISAVNVMLDAIGYFKADSTASGAYFGWSIALSGDGNTLAVGSLSNAGRVYIFARSGAMWLQQANLTAPNADTGDYFGYSIALSDDGNTLAVGAYGEASAITGIGRIASSDNSAPFAGAVYLYVRLIGGVWEMSDYIKASNTQANCQFGYSVALGANGQELAVGARFEGSLSGAVYIFGFNKFANRWSEDAYVKASNAGGGDRFGSSVAFNTNAHTLAVGASYEDSMNLGVILGSPDENATPNGIKAGDTDSGAVYIFTTSDYLTWSQQAYVKPSNTAAGDYFGTSVALSSDGNTLAVGADGAVANTGAGYVFSRTNTDWMQEAYITASNANGNDRFGTSIALSADGNTLAVGAAGEDSAAINGNQMNDCAAASPINCAYNSGAAYVYTRSVNIWTQQAYVKASNTQVDNYFGISENFGISIALSADGNTLAAGAYGEGSAATGVNNTTPGQGDISAPGAGAVYLY